MSGSLHREAEPSRTAASLFIQAHVSNFNKQLSWPGIPFIQFFTPQWPQVHSASTPSWHHLLPQCLMYKWKSNIYLSQRVLRLPGSAAAPPPPGSTLATWSHQLTQQRISSWGLWLEFGVPIKKTWKQEGQRWRSTKNEEEDVKGKRLTWPWTCCGCRWPAGCRLCGGQRSEVCVC